MKSTFEKKLLLFILLPFLLILGVMVVYIVHLHITLSGNDTLVEIKSATILAAAVVLCAVASLVIVLRYARKNISIPVKNLAAAADRISRDALTLDMPFSYITGDKDEIAVMSQAIYRMMEQLRVHKIKQEQVQMITAAQLQFKLFKMFAKETDNMPQAARMVLALLGYQYKTAKITIVYTSAGVIHKLTSHAESVLDIQETSFFTNHTESAMQ